jgi:hypothetical protein
MTATTLTVYLVNQAADLGGFFDASHRTTCATLLEGFFKDVIKSCAQKYNAVSVKWDGKKGDPTATDLVCYVLKSTKGSIVDKKGSGGILGLSGSTAQATVDNSLISEVYLQQIVQNGLEGGNATTNRENAVAACIFHELAHNILDASTPLITDVHKMTGGVVLRDTGPKPLTPTEVPNDVDKAKFANGFVRRTAGVKQYVDEMPT